MAKKKSKQANEGRSGKGRKSAASRATPSVAANIPRATATEIKAAKEKFEQGVIARGEAVPAGEPLKSGVTHEIVTSGDGSPPELVRKRFSMF